MDLSKNGFAAYWIFFASWSEQLSRADSLNIWNLTLNCKFTLNRSQDTEIGVFVSGCRRDHRTNCWIH